MATALTTFQRYSAFIEKCFNRSGNSNENLLPYMTPQLLSTQAFTVVVTQESLPRKVGGKSIFAYGKRPVASFAHIPARCTLLAC